MKSHDHYLILNPISIPKLYVKCGFIFYVQSEVTFSLTVRRTNRNEDDYDDTWHLSLYFVSSLTLLTHHQAKSTTKCKPSTFVFEMTKSFLDNPLNSQLTITIELKIKTTSTHLSSCVVLWVLNCENTIT